MATKKRAKRPELDRVAPIRDFSRIFGLPGSGESGRPKNVRQPPDAAPPSGSIPGGVTLGYQVIEDYIRQGEEFARAMSGAPGGSPASFFSSPSAGNGAGDLQATAGRLFQVVADFAAAWTDLMQTTSNRRPDPLSRQPRPDFPGFEINKPSTPAPPATPREASTQVAQQAPLTLRLDSKRRVEVAVDIRPEAGAGRIVAHDLRAIDATLPRIENVQIERGTGGGLVIQLRIEDDQPVGVYSGIVVDEQTNLPRGTLSVRVLDVGPGMSDEE